MWMVHWFHIFMTTFRITTCTKPKISQMWFIYYKMFLMYAIFKFNILTGPTYQRHSLIGICNIVSYTFHVLFNTNIKNGGYEFRLLFLPSIISSISFCVNVGNQVLNSLSRQEGRHFPDGIFKCIILNDIVQISINISLKLVPKGPDDNCPALVQIMAWRRTGDKPLSEPMSVCSPTHIYFTRPQWVNVMIIIKRRQEYSYNLHDNSNVCFSIQRRWQPGPRKEYLSKQHT